MEGATAQQTGAIVERFTLKAFVEACLVLEEGVSTLREIETGMMTGAGILPGPFTRADERGLDEMLAALERAQAEWGDRFTPPIVLRRLVAQGRLGKKSGQGFFPYPQPDGDLDQKETVLLETRGAVAIIWLNRPPANPLSPQVITEFGELWKHCHASDKIRSVVIASSNIFTFSAGADIKEFTKMDASAGRGPAGRRPRDAARDGDVEHDDHRGGEQHRVRRRLRAGDGVRLPHRGRVGDVRAAGDQPRDHSRLRRHAAAAAARG